MLLVTIIKHSQCSHTVPHQAIDAHVTALMLEHPVTTWEERHRALKLFDCHCHCVGATISVDALAAPFIEPLLHSFLGSLCQTDLVQIGVEARRRIARSVMEMLGGLRSHIPDLEIPKWDITLPNLHQAAWNINKKNLVPAHIAFWNGWKVISRKNKNIYLKLHSLFKSHGAEFTQSFYEQVKRHARKRAKPQTSAINTIAAFIASNAELYPPSAFKNPSQMRLFFQDLFLWYHVDGHNKNRDPQAVAKNWRIIANTAITIFCDTRTWNVLTTEIPIPPVKNKGGHELNVKRNRGGIKVKDKLLTEVPLYLTDIQAIDLLYSEIDEDQQTMRKWAASRCRLIRKAQLQRTRSTTGQILSVRDRSSCHHDDLRKTGIDNIYKTFNTEGLLPLQEMKKRYSRRTHLLAQILGIPNNYSLFPFQCLLVAEHPALTPSFFDNFELYNERGNRVGFNKIDNHYELVGYKDRKGNKSSEQKIKLSPRVACLVRQVEQITTPLRDYLKKIGDPAWRYLFLVTGGSLVTPKSAAPQPWSSNKIGKSPELTAELEAQFSPFTTKRGEDLHSYIKKFTLTRIRAQTAVCDYILNNNTVRMATMLGHTTYSKNLLLSYLPYAIYEFFETRYVRIFQKGLICYAMKDSKYLLRASKFQSMEELHNFLSSYALTDIPENLKDPQGDNLVKDGEISEVCVAITKTTLLILMSVAAAVRLSVRPEKIRGAARYWANFAHLIVSHIETGKDRKLKSYLAYAHKNLDTASVEAIIHATPS